jgi:Cys-rich protein (TIGR01571 family)
MTCPCILAGRINARLTNPEQESFPSTNPYVRLSLGFLDISYDGRLMKTIQCFSCCALTTTMIAAAPLYCFMTVATRREVRYRYHIKGNNCDDCWQATFFPCCAFVQEEKEILWRREREKSGLVGIEGYGVRKENMEYGKNGG